MKLNPIFLLLFAPLLISAAIADNSATYQSLWNAVASDPDCKPSQFPDLTLFTCNTEMTLWYFTKANHPANPGVIERKLQKRADGIYVDEQGWPFAPESERGAFDAWMAQIKALDASLKQQLHRRSGG